jgi:hypothetical protein
MRGKRGSSKRPRCPWCMSDFIGTTVDGRLEWVHPEPNNCPTPSRAQHDQIERVGASTRGQYASGWRSKTNLELLETRGVISRDQREAGEGFTARFRQAAFDPLRAVNLPEHTPLGSIPGRTEIADRAIYARDWVWSRVTVLGGINALPGSLCWGVLGLEKTLTAWSLERRLYGAAVNEHNARGILVSVLSVLAVDPISRTWHAPRPRYEAVQPAGQSAPAPAS